MVTAHLCACLLSITIVVIPASGGVQVIGEPTRIVATDTSIEISFNTT